jgi:EpsI family protein
VGYNLRFTLAVALLASAALLLHTRTHNEILPPREKLASFPYRFGTWVGTDVSVPQDVLDNLGPGDFIFRNYQNARAGDPSVDLFVAYFPSQQMGDTIHSPRNCLPGAGWMPLASSRVEIPLPERKPLFVNRYLMAKGGKRALVLYWYWAHNQATASEYWAKFYLIEDSIRLHRSDGALIRVTTELKRAESADVAQERLLSLLRSVVPALEPYVPR